METKICSDCHEEKSLDNFHKSSKGNCFSLCKTCIIVKQKEARNRTHKKKVAPLLVVKQETLPDPIKICKDNQVTMISSFINSGMSFTFSVPSINLIMSNV